MSHKKILSVFALALCLVVPTVAQADIFVWHNQDADVSMTYPDRWGVLNNQAYDEVLRIAAPTVSERFEEAQCRMRVRKDERFKMHPISHSDELQRQYYSGEFWEDYTNEFKYGQINHVQNNAGLGRGFASFADITFESFEHPRMMRRGIAFVSLYENQVHIIECSVEQKAYSIWYPSFMDIIKSVDFDGNDAVYRNGYYRNFYEGATVIKGRRPMDSYVF